MSSEPAERWYRRLKQEDKRCGREEAHTVQVAICAYDDDMGFTTRLLMLSMVRRELLLAEVCNLRFSEGCFSCGGGQGCCQFSSFGK